MAVAVSFHDEYLDRLDAPSDVQYCMPWMRGAALRYSQTRVLELGVRSGNSTCAFLAGVERSRGHVWSVDTMAPGVPEHWAESGLWSFICGDDLAVPLPEGGFDIVFIDTSHSYAHTLAELHRFVPLVREGGTVLLHDTLLEHVDGDPQPFPVAHALGTFCRETGREWTEHGGTYGFGEIARPNG
jgi:predicted O-methyltransferase YrrM